MFTPSHISTETSSIIIIYYHIFHYYDVSYSEVRRVSSSEDSVGEEEESEGESELIEVLVHGEKILYALSSY